MQGNVPSLRLPLAHATDAAAMPLFPDERSELKVGRHDLLLLLQIVRCSSVAGLVHAKERRLLLHACGVHAL